MWILHIGDYKTGTTFLQEKVFPFIDNVIYLGDPIQDPDLDYALRLIADKEYLSEFDTSCIRCVIRAIEARYYNKVILISRECLSSPDPFVGDRGRVAILRVKEFFGDVHFFYGLRDEEGFTQSMYRQYCRTGGYLSFADFRTYFDAGNTRRYDLEQRAIEIANWCSSKCLTCYSLSDFCNEGRDFKKIWNDAFGCKIKIFPSEASNERVPDAINNMFRLFNFLFNPAIHRNDASKLISCAILFIYFRFPTKVVKRRREFISKIAYTKDLDFYTVARTMACGGFLERVYRMVDRRRNRG